MTHTTCARTDGRTDGRTHLAAPLRRSAATPLREEHQLLRAAGGLGLAPELVVPCRVLVDHVVVELVVLLSSMERERGRVIHIHLTGVIVIPLVSDARHQLDATARGLKRWQPGGIH